MKTTTLFPFLFGFVALLLGVGIQAYPLKADASTLDSGHGDADVLSEWQKAYYNLTIGDCPSYFDNGLREQETTGYTCRLFCDGQYGDGTKIHVSVSYYPDILDLY